MIIHKKTFFGFLLVAGVIISGCSKPPIDKSIYVDGKNVFLYYGDSKVVAQMEPVATKKYYIKEGYEGHRSDGSLCVFPLDQAESLRNVYGNNFAESAPRTKGTIEIMVLYTANSQVRDRIKKVIDAASGNPVVEITGKKLDVQLNTIKDQKYTAQDGNIPENYYLIDDINITQQHF